MKGPLYQNFARLHTELDWGPRTARTYWSHLMKLKAYMGQDASPVDKDYTRTLQTAAAQAPIWDLEDAAEFLSQRKVEVLMTITRFLPPRHIFHAGALTFCTGQRLSDVLLLEADQVWLVTGPQGIRTSIRFTKGKTVGVRGPYTISIPPSTELESMTKAAAQKALQSRADTLFATNAELLTRALDIDVRALRRTGLSRIAMSGTPLDVLLTLSRHASTRMLEVYLASGLFDQNTATAQIQAIANAMQTPVPQASRCSAEL